MFQKILATIRNTREIHTLNRFSTQFPCESVMVISANLGHPWPRLQRGEERLLPFIRLVKEHQADLLILQEVWQTHRHQVHELLAEKLGMNAVYARTNGDRFQIGFEEGLAILSRFPLTSIGLKTFRSSLHPFARRQALAATVKTPCGDLVAVSAHLSINPWRNRRQVEELIQWVESLAPHAVIGGDFNAPETTPRIEKLAKRWLDTLRQVHPQHRDPTTHRINLPLIGEWRQRLDYLFLYQREKTWRVLNSGNEGQYSFSDHAAVWTQLSLHLLP